MKSINPQEIEKFSRIADEWWNPNGKFKPLHKFNPTRLEYIVKVIFEKPSTINHQPLTILDIGCGGGLLSVPLARLGAKVTGIDASEKNIQVASLYAEREEIEIEYLCTSAEELSAQNRKFDVVLNMEVIEHVADVESFMQASCNLVKEGGLILIATLNRNLKSLAFAKIGAEYILNWLPKGTHDWNKFLKPSEIHNLLETNNCKPLEAKGVTYKPFKDKFELSDDLSVNYMILARKG
ncbi:MAG: bifunctional 2-polyprenyl-6-hydroxyphenol methylase/3-demethylubiquinol 3-O-methyltransferase UbiG [Rickettsiales bacterium]|nr:bifunctional 2-polyprenyl-6-hydroxyphenol methylase/3-demethylubiquinol 3-O-methyltransferase UbiG [Rickettsiales bacterium]